MRRTAQGAGVGGRGEEGRGGSNSRGASCMICREAEAGHASQLHVDTIVLLCKHWPVAQLSCIFGECKAASHTSHTHTHIDRFLFWSPLLIVHAVMCCTAAVLCCVMSHKGLCVCGAGQCGSSRLSDGVLSGHDAVGPGHPPQDLLRQGQGEAHGLSSHYGGGAW